MSENTSRISTTRRSLVKSAAWSVPVIALATAAPAYAASTVTPAPATFWGTGATASVTSGNVTNYTLEGTDSEGDPALLPIGARVTITPEAGVTLVLFDATGLTAVLNPDGSITATILSADLTNVRLRFRPSGASGLGYTITTNINIEPFTQDIDVNIR